MLVIVWLFASLAFGLASADLSKVARNTTMLEQRDQTWPGYCWYCPWRADSPCCQYPPYDHDDPGRTYGHASKLFKYDDGAACLYDSSTGKPVPYLGQGIDHRCPQSPVNTCTDKQITNQSIKESCPEKTQNGEAHLIDGFCNSGDCQSQDGQAECVYGHSPDDPNPTKCGYRMWGELKNFDGPLQQYCGVYVRTMKQRMHRNNSSLGWAR